MTKNKLSVDELKGIAKQIRKDIIESLAIAGSGHIGASLGLADIFTYLYFYEMKHNPKNPLMTDRDKLILSIGHVAPVLYASLANAGYFDKELLKSLRKIESPLQGHPHRKSGIPGIETSSGSLGQGLSIAVGMAIADKTDKIHRNIFCIMGDGEIQEGQIWEAAMSAAFYKLDNIIAIIDRNYLQIDGETKNVMCPEPLNEKWKSFGWEVLNCDANKFDELINTFKKTKNKNGKPKIIIANTIMGKGVEEIENDYNWHGKAPDPTQAKRFLKLLK